MNCCGGQWVVWLPYWWVASERWDDHVVWFGHRQLIGSTAVNSWDSDLKSKFKSNLRYRPMRPEMPDTVIYEVV